MGQVKIIKRYQNRKLYDTSASCYVTLDEIAEMVQENEEVTVIDNQTQNDITASTFTQIIFEKQKRSDDCIPVSTLRHVIRQGNDCFSSLSKVVENGTIRNVIQSLERQVETLSAKVKSLESGQVLSRNSVSIVNLEV